MRKFIGKKGKEKMKYYNIILKFKEILLKINVWAIFQDPYHSFNQINGFLSCLLYCICVGLWGLSQKPSMSIFLNCKTEVIDATAKYLPCHLQSLHSWIMDFHMFSLNSIDQGHTRSPASACTTDLSMFADDNKSHRYKHCPLYHHKPCTSSWPLVAAKANDINLNPYMVPSGRTAHRH